jgi:hypothetical protein
MLNDIIRNAHVPVVDVSQLTQSSRTRTLGPALLGAKGSSVPDLLLGPLRTNVQHVRLQACIRLEPAKPCYSESLNGFASLTHLINTRIS